MEIISVRLKRLKELDYFSKLLNENRLEVVRELVEEGKKLKAYVISISGGIDKWRLPSRCEHNQETLSTKRNNLTSFVSSKSLSFGTLQWEFL